MDRLHLLFLDVYRRLPTWARRRVVRALTPTFTVGAVCFIERGDGSILLVRQVYRNHWGIPGGHLQRGEDASDGARREVLEEVGLAVDLLGEPLVTVDAEARRVDIIYRAMPMVGADLDDLRPCSPEIVEVRWFPREQLPELQHETADALVKISRDEIVGAG